MLASTQLTRLVGDLTLRGASETLLSLLALSEAWNYTSWVTNYFDPTRGRCG
jgi:low temperature requirement protein LtrA